MNTPLFQNESIADTLLRKLKPEKKKSKINLWFLGKFFKRKKV